MQYRNLNSYMHLIPLGEWHQYDDIVHAPSTSSSSSVLVTKTLQWAQRANKWLHLGIFDKKKDITEGRNMAGKIMLESIFKLLSTWSEMNLKSFFTQLKQFYQIYANPYVYEDGAKQWHDLNYGDKDVSFLPHIK